MLVQQGSELSFLSGFFFYGRYRLAGFEGNKLDNVLDVSVIDQCDFCVDFCLTVNCTLL